MNIVEYVFISHVGSSSGYMARSGIAGYSGSPMSYFFEEPLNGFPESLYQLAIQPEVNECSSSPHPSQHLLLPEVWVSAILTGMRRNLRVVSIFISLMTSDVEHFHRYFSAIQ